MPAAQPQIIDARHAGADSLREFKGAESLGYLGLYKKQTNLDF